MIVKTRLYLFLSRTFGFLSHKHFEIALKLFLETLEKCNYITINKYSLQVNKDKIIKEIAREGRKRYYMLSDFEII